MNETTMQTTTINDRRDALRVLIDNRRKGMSFEQAIRTLRIVLHGDRQGQALLDEIEASPPAS